MSNLIIEQKRMLKEDVNWVDDFMTTFGFKRAKGERMIKMKIDKPGFLCILRGSKLKLQGCMEKYHYCSDECPAFQEPRLDPIEDDEVVLQLCCTTHRCKQEEFLDERE